MARRPSTSGRDIVRAYDQAVRSERNAGHKLTAKGFLDIVAPSKHGRSESSAARYIRKLRSGERSGTMIEKRAMADTGRRINVSFIDRETGEIRSANVVIPYGQSRLDIFRPSKRNRHESALRRTAEEYLAKAYPKAQARTRKWDILGIRSIKHARQSENVK